MSKLGRVLVAMSGGIDSTVAAMLLHDQGYELVGITMKTWDYQSAGGSKKETGCCSLDSINDARNIAVDLGFPHYVVDIRATFDEYVINNFVDEYIAGRTPNPCVLCNTHIKWEALLKKADSLGCDYIATGHYARINTLDGKYYISRGTDLHKDQSYVLWGVSQECLSRTLFPLADYTKPEVREICHKRGYTDFAKKAESYEICFVPDNDYRSFLKRKRPDLEKTTQGGDFVDQSGNKIGVHLGYPFYTIGQRKGLGQAFGKPMYVTAIFPDTNVVQLGEVDDLMKNGMIVTDINLMKYNEISHTKELKTMVRYNDAGAMANVKQIDENTMEVTFLANVKGIAPGQSAVFYEDDDLVGGGIIKNSL